jgi:hypothetical protein
MIETKALKELTDKNNWLFATEEGDVFDGEAKKIIKQASAELDALLADNFAQHDANIKLGDTIVRLRKELSDANEKLDFYNKATATAFLERIKKDSE